MKSSFQIIVLMICCFVCSCGDNKRYGDFEEGNYVVVKYGTNNSPEYCWRLENIYFRHTQGGLFWTKNISSKVDTENIIHISNNYGYVKVEAKWYFCNEKQQWKIFNESYWENALSVFKVKNNSCDTIIGKAESNCGEPRTTDQSSKRSF